MKIGYIMSRFPKLTETFVLYEMVELIGQGVDVQIYPLLRERESVSHPDVASVMGRVHHAPLFSLKLIAANLRYMLRQPKLYFGALREVLRGTLGSLNFFVGALGAFPKAAQYASEMQRDGVQHVHAHFATHATVAALVVHRLTGLPFSFTAHAHDLFVDRHMLAHKIKASAFAVAISSYNKELMIREAGEEERERIHVVHCGVDPERFASVRREHRVGPMRIICVGSLEERKGQSVLIDGCRNLRDRGVQVRCELVGSGPWRERLQNQVREHGLQNVVAFEGSRSRPEVIASLAHSDVMVLASMPIRNGKSEGIPVALMEAMACGLPVVSTAITGIPELVSDGVSGFLVPPRDPVALADALSRLSESPSLRERFGHAGQSIVARDFNLHSEAAKLRQLIARGAAEDTPVEVAHRVA